MFSYTKETHKRTAEEKLMISVLTRQIIDYLNSISISEKLYGKAIQPSELKLYDGRGKGSGLKKNKRTKRKYAELNRGQKAEAYIFNNDRNSEFYVFGFKFICKHIGLDPERLRKRIKETKMEQVKWRMRHFERIK